ncbi:MAG TPA: hypothetical protein VH297_13250 [Gaiellaceae bacterium]
MSLSPRVRILAAALGVAVLALAGGFMLLGGGGSSSEAAAKTIQPLHPVKNAVVKVKKQPAAATARRAVKPAAKPAVKPAAKRVVKPAPKPKARPKRLPAVIDGMPAALALALRSHKVVVVSLYTPGADLDAMATAEARHGAAIARAGFLALNVADDKIVAPLSSLLSGAPTAADRVLDGPAVLVFDRPNALFVRFNGFADSDTVAQAAANAATLAQ